MLAPGGDFRHVGTTLFSMAVHPKSGKIFIGNTDARNSVRFDGPDAGVAQDGRFASTTVRGHVAESRITVLDPGDHSVKPVHLNAHIDYAHCCAPAPNVKTERSPAFPVGLAISKKRGPHGQLLDAQDLYIAALGSDKIAVLPTSRLEQAASGQPVQDRSDHIEVTGGPAGLELDEERDRLYVLARFTNELVVVSTRTRKVIERHRMFDPEPAAIVEGRHSCTTHAGHRATAIRRARAVTSSVTSMGCPGTSAPPTAATSQTWGRSSPGPRSRASRSYRGSSRPRGR